MDFQYRIDDVELLDTPALVVYPDIVRRNIHHAVQIIGDVDRLRPHVKTNKSPEATRLMLDAGIRKFKCATIAEAEMLGMCGAPDVLLAYQPVGPKLERFIAVVEKCPATKYSCLVDNLQAAQCMSDAFAQRQLKVSAFIDLNIGMNRTGISPDDAWQLFPAWASMPGFASIGLHAYDGHLRAPDFVERKKACDETFLQVTNLKNKIVEAGYPEPLIVAGGSPTFPVHASRQEVECSPGTFIYWDKGYGDLCSEQPFQPAALLVTRVVSLPSNGKSCLDLGHKSVAAENPIDQRVFFPDAPFLKPVGQSEEHLVVEIAPGYSLEVGEVLYGIPFHICPTVALYERAFTVENGQLTGEWEAIARNRKITC